MAGDTTFSIVGNLTEDPRLSFTSSGIAVANVTIASTPRSFNKQANEWKDGETLFMRGTVWRQPAENAAESFARGMRVIASGRLVQRSWEKDGEKRTSVEMEIDEIGPSIRYATVKVNKADRSSGQDRTPVSAPAGGPADDDEPPF